MKKKSKVIFRIIVISSVNSLSLFLFKKNKSLKFSHIGFTFYLFL